MASDSVRSLTMCASVAIALLFSASAAAAQFCPDGTRRDKDRGCAPASAPRLDLGRIAVLPLRTTGAAPELAYLGNGLMELLSAEFNGAVGPEAVEPGEALRAWQQAVTKRAPTNADYLRVARSLGAGQVAIGSLVGSPDRFSVTTTIHNVADGAVRIPPVKVDGSEGNLTAVTTMMGTQVLGRAAGVAQGTSNEATRALLDGLAAYRTRPFRFEEVQRHLLRAAQLDTTFVLPAYRLVVAHAIGGPSNWGIRDYESSFRNLWKQRHTLSSQQRVLLEALADSSGLYFRMQALPRLRDAVRSLPNSAEAWHVLATQYDFVGAAIGIEDWAEQARRAALRATQLDEALCPNCARRVLRNLAYLDGDARAFARYLGDGPSDQYFLAILKRDPSAIRAARMDYARDLSGNQFMPAWLVGGVPLPIAEADSLLAEVRALANTDEQKRRAASWISMASHFAGRPTRAWEELRRMFGTDTSPAYLGAILEYAYDDSTAAERLVSLLDRVKIDSLNARQLADIRGTWCDVGLSRLRRADTTGVRGILGQLRPVDGGLVEVLADIRRGQVEKVCAQVLRGAMASLDPSGGPLLHRADSLMRYMPLNVDMFNYDLGLAFARRGEYTMAAAAARRHVRNIVVWRQARLVLSLRDGGRWAALAGDTASAIKSFREYLIYRADPEHALVPERDSIRAELTALERTYRPKRPTRPSADAQRPRSKSGAR
jgi:hypothetical protein